MALYQRDRLGRWSKDTPANELRRGKADHATDERMAGQAIVTAIDLADDQVHHRTRLSLDRGFGRLQRQIAGQRVFGMGLRGAQVRHHAQLPGQTIEQVLIGGRYSVAGRNGEGHGHLLLDGLGDGATIPRSGRFDNRVAMSDIDTPGV